jgi:hypothetical protein
LDTQIEADRLGTAITRMFDASAPPPLLENELALRELLHVAAYIDGLCKDFEKPTVKQHLAATRDA